MHSLQILNSVFSEQSIKVKIIICGTYIFQYTFFKIQACCSPWNTKHKRVASNLGGGSPTVSKSKSFLFFLAAYLPYQSEHQNRVIKDMSIDQKCD